MLKYSSVGREFYADSVLRENFLRHVIRMCKNRLIADLDSTFCKTVIV